MQRKCGFFAGRVVGTHDFDLVNSVLDLLIDWIQYYIISLFTILVLLKLSGNSRHSFLHDSGVRGPSATVQLSISRFDALLQLLILRLPIPSSTFDTSRFSFTSSHF